jgi:predicted DNA-binding ribbon-helix-helix protein
MSAASERSCDEPSADARLLPRFRVLIIDGARRAFKLEPVYWSALSAIAARRRRTLAAEVVERLKSAPPRMNHSAFLRASVAGDLYDMSEAQQARPSVVGWSNVIEAIAEPAFVAMRAGRLTALNAPMRALLRARGLALEADPTDVSLEIAPGALTLLNRSQRSEPVVCNAGFRKSGHRVSCRVRLVPSRVGAEGGVDCVFIGFSAPT